MEYDVCQGSTLDNKPVPYSIRQQMFGTKMLPISSFRMELLDQRPRQTKIYKPGEEIKGKLFMANPEDFGCLAIVVALDCSATTNYKSGTSTRTKTENLLPFFGGHDWASTFIVGRREDFLPFLPCTYPQLYIVKKSEKEICCPFSIPIRKLNPFPGTFKGASGEISYRVEAYVASLKITNIRAVQQSIIIHSYLNIEAMPHLFELATVKGEQYNSFYSKKKIKYSLTLTASGYLPGESLRFYFNLNNPHGRNVSKVSIALMKRVTFTSDFTSRCSKAIIASRENNQIHFNSAGNFYWKDSLVVPIGSPATFEGHVIKLQCVIKVDIFSNDKSDFPLLKGDSPITIGSIREDESLSFENLPLTRSMSVASLSSLTDYLIPPAYEQILSQASSMETLPPHYDDLFLKN